MRIPIIKIGNSRGIRLPKTIIEQCGFGEEAELEVRNNKIIIKPIKKPRQNWEKAFRKMAENKDDRLIEFPSVQWDEEEWEWK